MEFYKIDPWTQWSRLPVISELMTFSTLTSSQSYPEDV
jgi:hypothetical protein